MRRRFQWRPWLAVAATVAALMPGLRPAPAAAHVVDPGVRTVLDSIMPPMPGVVVQVATSVAPQLVLDNPTAQPVEVLAPTGEPFLRITASGVSGNFHSPAWYLGNTPNGIAAIPTSASASAAPDWLPVSSGSSWGWYDHRLHPQAVTVSPAVAQGTATVRLFDWSIPVLDGGTLVAIRGHDEFRPVLGTITSALTSPAEAAPGVTLTLLPGVVPGVDLVVSGEHTVVVLGPAGEPFARITATGAQVNVRSPEWVDNELASGRTPAQAADATAPPSWLSQGSQPSLAWIEPRAAWPHVDPPDAVVRAGVPAVLMTWRLPLQVDGRAVTVTGTTGWAPIARPSPAAQPGAAPAAAADAAGGWRFPWAGAVTVAVIAVLLTVALSVPRGLRPRRR